MNQATTLEQENLQAELDAYKQECTRLKNRLEAKQFYSEQKTSSIEHEQKNVAQNLTENVQEIIQSNDRMK